MGGVSRDHLLLAYLLSMEVLKYFFFKNGPNPASFCLFAFFSQGKYSTNTTFDKSIDTVLVTQTRGGRMVGTDESTELWWHPWVLKYLWSEIFLNVRLWSTFSLLQSGRVHCQERASARGCNGLTWKVLKNREMEKMQKHKLCTNETLG